VGDPRVDEYIATLPPDHQEVLRKLRADVARHAPEAVETISYGMPAFKLDGKFLVSYAGWKRHCSVYPIDDGLLERHAGDVGDYGRTKGAIHFSKDRPLPDAFVEDLVRGRIAAVRAGRGY
jgi:uncharacterized protein YdhG (YjbR/CyaY superfamily)